MDIQSFLADNSSAIIGLAGVIIGAILAFIPSTLHRIWQVSDQRKQWRRDRLLFRLSPIQEWLDNTLRFCGTFAMLLEVNSMEEFSKIKEENNLHRKDHQKLDTIVYSHAVSTGDVELLNLVKNVKSLRDSFFEAAIQPDKNTINAHIALLEAVTSKTARRIEFLVEDAKPVGGVYHDKSLFSLIRRKWNQLRNKTGR